MERKKCNYCGKTKNIGEFYVTKRKTLPDFIHARCYNCEKSIMNKKRSIERKIPGSREYLDRKKYRLKYRSLFGYKRRSKKHDWIFDLDLNFINDIKLQPCIYCGYTGEGMSIDRKNNDIGYIKNNCVSACYVCNTIKNSWFTFEEMMEFGKLVKKIRSNREISIKLFINRVTKPAGILDSTRRKVNKLNDRISRNSKLTRR